MKKQLTTTLFLLVLICTVQAQAGYTKKYFDKEWKPTKEENATYYRIAKYNKKGKPIGLVKDYYMNTGTLQGESHLLSENPDVLDGELVTYFENGSLQSKAYYKKGIPIGTTYIYELPKFYLHTQKSYLSRTIVHNSNSQPEKVYSFSEFNQRDTTGVCYLKDNLLHGPYWSRNMLRSEYGTYNKGKRSGKHIIYDLISKGGHKTDTIITVEDNYVEDKLDGIKKVYSYNNKKQQLRLYAIHNYKAGLMDGKSINYYSWEDSPDKIQVRDSAVYKENKLIGANYVYTKDGSLDYIVVLDDSFRYTLQGDSITYASLISNSTYTKLILPSTIKYQDKIYTYRTLKTIYPYKLKTISLPNTIKRIEQNAFQSGNWIEEINLPDSLESIGFGAFKNTQIKSIRIPASVKTMTGNPFSGACRLNQIELDSNNNYFCVENGVLFNKTKTVLIAYLQKSQDSVYVIPSSVVEIADGAFSNANGLKKIIASKSLKLIGASAFAYCVNLKEIELPNSVLKIGNKAFESCHKLERIRIPSKVKAIQAKTFASCYALKELVLPSSLDTIAFDAFTECGGLNRVKFPPSLKYIASGAFSNTRMTEVDIPNSTTLMADAFHHCFKIKYFKYSNSNNVYYNNFGAFCSIDSLVISDNITKIYSNYNQLYFNAVVLPKSLKEIQPSFFYKQNGLREIIAKSKVPASTEYFFEGMSKDVASKLEQTVILKVPQASVELYKKTYPWSVFKNIQGL